MKKDFLDIYPFSTMEDIDLLRKWEKVSGNMLRILKAVTYGIIFRLSQQTMLRSIDRGINRESTAGNLHVCKLSLYHAKVTEFYGGTCRRKACYALMLSPFVAEKCVGIIAMAPCGYFQGF